MKLSFVSVERTVAWLLDKKYPCHQVDGARIFFLQVR